MKDINRVILQLINRLNLNVKIEKASLKGLPLALREVYGFYDLVIEGVGFVAVYVESLQVVSFKKHLKLLEEKLKLPIVLFVNSLSKSARDYLMENRISFVSQKVIYLPRVLVYLDDIVQKKAVSVSGKKLSKLSQQVFLFAIVRRLKTIDSSYIITNWNVTKMSASRVLNELEAFGFADCKKQGRAKSYYLKVDSLSDLLSKIKTPVVGYAYISKKALQDLNSFCRSGFDALSVYSDIASFSSEIAIEKNQFNRLVKEKKITTYDFAYEQEFVKVELWRYDPICLEGVVEPFSLYMLLKDKSEDERSLSALNELYNELERIIDDTRA